eukprot:SAG11_NODE_3376_length_2488_cov_49.264964_1_plen_63_part_00
MQNFGEFFLEIFVCTRFSGVPIQYPRYRPILYRYSEIIKPTVEKYLLKHSIQLKVVFSPSVC